MKDGDQSGLRHSVLGLFLVFCLFVFFPFPSLSDFQPDLRPVERETDFSSPSRSWPAGRTPQLLAAASPRQNGGAPD